MRRHRRDYEVISEMNLTNLLDTAFVLLITFIMVSPTVRQGLKIDLPQVQRNEDISVTKNVTIVIKKHEIEGVSDQIVVDDHRYSLDDTAPDSLKTLVEEKKRQNPTVAIIVEADRNSSYETFAKVVSLLKGVGVENIGLSTDPLEPDASKKKKRG